MTKARSRLVPRGRRLLLEPLEQRLPLTGWQNAFDRLDVNDDAMVAPVDVLILINKQNAEGSGPLTGQAVKNDPLVDVNGNNLFEPNDVLIVVNALNQTGPLPPRKVNIPLTTDGGVQQMPSVAIDPNDADNVVVAYMDYSLRDTGYAGLAVAVSRNGGTSWTTRPLPLPAGFDQGAANPIAKFDDHGRVYVSYMAATFLGEEKPGLTNPVFGAPRVPGFQSNNGIFVVRSDDWGGTWNEPVGVDPNVYGGIDEVPFDAIPDMAIDLFPVVAGEPNANYGNIVVSWSRSYPSGLIPGFPDADGGIEVRVAVSRDSGVSWESDPRDQRSRILVDLLDPSPVGNLPGFGFIGHPHIAVGPGGVYISHFAGGNYGVNVSRDGGVTFQPPDFANPCEPGLPVGCQIVFGTGFATAVDETLPNNQFRTTIQRAIAADPVRPGTVYALDPISVVDEFGSQLDAADIFFGRSSDFALTWNTTQHQVGAYPDVSDVVCDEGTGFACIDNLPLNDDNENLSVNVSPAAMKVVSGQAITRIATGSDGSFGAIWYDTRRDPNDTKLEVFGAVSLDGGTTFSRNFRITDMMFDASDGEYLNANGEQEFYIGDYLGLGIGGNAALAAWTDTRQGNQDIFLAKMLLDALPSPPNDRFEPNDTPERDGSPTVLGPVIQRTLPNLALTPNDVDWFLVETSAQGNLNALLLLDDPDHVTPEDFEFQLWDAAATAVLATGEDVVDPNNRLLGQRVTLPVGTGEEYLVRVRGTGIGEVRYTLSVESLTENLGSQVHKVIRAEIESGQRALFFVRVGATGSFDFGLASEADVSGELSFTVLDAESGEMIRRIEAIGASQIVELDVTVRREQSLLIQVEGVTGGTGSIWIEMTNRDLFSVDGIGSSFFSVAGAPSQATLGDVNGDGHLDSVVISTHSNTVSVLLGNGDGTLQAARQFPIGAFVLPDADVTKQLPLGRDVILADFDEDQRPDIVGTNYASADVSILLGRGDGTVFPQRRAEATPLPFDLDVGDIDNDGHLDVVVVEAGLGSRQAALATLLGIGDGSFRPQRISRFPVDVNNNGTLRIADIDEDGNPDVVISGDGIAREFTVVFGDGTGSFEYRDGQSDFFGGRLAIALDVDDINEDGHLDVVTLGYEEGEGVLSLGTGDGGFRDPIAFEGGQAPTAVEFFDFGSEVEAMDGTKLLGPPDGHLDLVVAYSGVKTFAPDKGTGPEVVVHPSIFDGLGQFVGFGRRQSLQAAFQQPRDVDVGDFNGDGVADILSVDQGGVLIVFGEPPQFTPNDTLATARDLGTVVHLVDQTQTIVPDRQNAFYKFTVPTEEITAADEVIDVSLLFQYTEGDGIGAELLDAQGNLLGSGDRFRVLAAQGEELTLRVFGVNGGSGAFTPIINVLPQVVAIEAQALLPGVGLNPGGPTTSIVVTLQGDRLDPDSAQDPANFTVTSFGPDRLFGTADDRVIPVQEIVYSPGTNVSISSGRTFPTAVRQTITLSTDEPLPPGSYRVDLSANIRTEDFNDQEAGQLADTAELVGHPVVSLESGRIVAGSRQVATGLVLPTTSVGDLGVFTMGTGFLTQLHADLAAQLDATLSDVGDDAQVTDNLLALLTERLVPTVGPSGQRITSLIAIWLDPVDLLFDALGQQIEYQQAAGTVTNNTDQCFVEVGGNIEFILCPLFNPLGALVTLDVSLVSDVSRGGALQITTDQVMTTNLTDPMREGETRFEFQY